MGRPMQNSAVLGSPRITNTVDDYINQAALAKAGRGIANRPTPPRSRAGQSATWKSREIAR
jgi:hypothetical protein